METTTLVKVAISLRRIAQHSINIPAAGTRQTWEQILTAYIVCGTWSKAPWTSFAKSINTTLCDH